MWLVKSLVGDRPSWHKEPINFLNKMLSIRKVRLLITSRYIAMQSYECVIISKMFLIYFISHGCNGGALVFLGGAEASASPSFALPMFITIKKKKILHLFLGVPAATVGGTGTPWHTRGYAPDANISSLLAVRSGRGLRERTSAAARMRTKQTEQRRIARFWIQYTFCWNFGCWKLNVTRRILILRTQARLNKLECCGKVHLFQ